MEITKPALRLRVTPQLDRVTVTRLDGEHEGDGEQYATASLPKQYHFLYLYVLKLVERIRKKVVRCTIIRTRQLDPHDRTTCFVTLTGSYTLNLPDGKVAFLKSSSSDIKLYSHRDRTGRIVPFQYDRDSLRAVPFDDAFNALRVIMHETIRCTECITKQRAKRLNHSKSWTVEWNADTGSVTDIKHEAAALSGKSRHFQNSKHGGFAEEGLFRGCFESETTLSSDYSDNNSECSISSVDRLRDKPLSAKCRMKREEMTLSTVEASWSTNATASSTKTIRSEASWRNSIDKMGGSGHLLHSQRVNMDDPDQIDIVQKMSDLTLSTETLNGQEHDDRMKREELERWTISQVAGWLLNGIGAPEVIGRTFFERKVDGKVLAMLDRKRIYAMFENVGGDQLTKQQIDGVFEKIAALQHLYSL